MSDLRNVSNCRSILFWKKSDTSGQETGIKIAPHTGTLPDYKYPISERRNSHETLLRIFERHCCHPRKCSSALNSDGEQAGLGGLRKTGSFTERPSKLSCNYCNDSGPNIYANPIGRNGSTIINYREGFTNL